MKRYAAEIAARREALAQLATEAEGLMPSPWWYDGRDILHHGKGTHVIRVVVPVDETWHKDLEIPDAVLAFIAAAHPAALLSLLAALDALEARPETEDEDARLATREYVLLRDDFEAACASQKKWRNRAKAAEARLEVAEPDVLAAECEKYGIPVGLSGLLRHLEGNRGLTAATDELTIELLTERVEAAEARLVAVEQERDDLEAALIGFVAWFDAAYPTGQGQSRPGVTLYSHVRRARAALAGLRRQPVPLNEPPTDAINDGSVAEMSAQVGGGSLSGEPVPPEQMSFIDSREGDAA